MVSIGQAIPFLCGVIDPEGARGYVEGKIFIMQVPWGVFILGSFLKT